MIPASMATASTAARLESIAEPGGIFVSRQAYDQVEGKLALRFRELGPQHLKNIAKPVEGFRSPCRWHREIKRRADGIAAGDQLLSRA
jgi:class 3 adenylate cyclase